MDVYDERFAYLHIQALMVSNMVVLPKDIPASDPLYALTMPELRGEKPAPELKKQEFDLEAELLREFERYDQPAPVGVEAKVTAVPENPLLGLARIVYEDDEMSDEHMQSLFREFS